MLLNHGLTDRQRAKTLNFDLTLLESLEFVNIEAMLTIL